MPAGSTRYGFYLEEFPPALKRKIFSNFDRRFMIILLFSFIFNIGAVLYLEKITSYEIDSKTITKIQEQYANLLLNRDFGNAITSRAGSGYQLDAKVISGLAKWMDNFTFDVFRSIDEFSTFDLPMAEADARETRGYSREELEGLRKTSAQRRLSSRDVLANEVRSVGLLGIISSRSQNVDYEYVQDLLEYATKNSDHLSQVLSKLSTIEIPHYGSISSIRKLKTISDYGQSAVIKGDRKSADVAINELIKQFHPIDRPETETVARNIHYEKIKSSYLNAETESKRERIKRSPAQVLNIVRSHMRALKDCYKQELRQNPHLKGKVVVRFTLNPEGAVVYASIVSSTLNSPRVESCILRRVRQWRNFPPCDPSIGNQTFRQAFKFGL